MVDIWRRMVVPPPPPPLGVSDVIGGAGGCGLIYHAKAEYGRALYWNADDYGHVLGVSAEASYTGF